jgi:hypothetical protein
MRSLVTDLRTLVETWREVEHPRDSDGKFGSGGGSGAGQEPELSKDEREFLRLRARRASDTKVRNALKLTQDQALRMAETLRAKLGLAPGGSLRDAARAMGIK